MNNVSAQAAQDRSAFTLTVSAVAKAAVANESLVRNLANRGVVTTIRDSNNRRLFSADAIDAVKRYLQNRPKRRGPRPGTSGFSKPRFVRSWSV